MDRVVASIEARMQSQRLPGKVLADVAGLPALTRLLHRLRQCQRLNDIVLATTDLAADDVLETWAQRAGVAVYRGSEADVLQRVVEAHRMMHSDIIVEVTGDSILLDPEVLDSGIALFLNNDCDIVSNTARPSYPMGVDVQVYRLDALADIERTQYEPAVREHVTLYFYRHPERYRIVHLEAPGKLRAPHLRFQLDYPEDLAFINAVWRELMPMMGEAFRTADVLRLLKLRPSIAALNAHCVEKVVL